MHVAIEEWKNGWSGIRGGIDPDEIDHLIELLIGPRLSARGQYQQMRHNEKEFAANLIERFKALSERTGKGYQTLINEALRAHLGVVEQPLTAEVVRMIIREELSHQG